MVRLKKGRSFGRLEVVEGGKKAGKRADFKYGNAVAACRAMGIKSDH